MMLRMPRKTLTKGKGMRNRRLRVKRIPRSDVVMKRSHKLLQTSIRPKKKSMKQKCN